MKKVKKIAAAALFGALVLVAVAAFADEPQDATNYYHYKPKEPINEAMEEAANENTEETHQENLHKYYGQVPEAENKEAVIPNFLSFSGVVREISPVIGNDGKPVRNEYYVRINSRDYGTTIFRTDYNTFILGEPVGVGDTISGWYASNTPVTLIYPPQHLAQVLVNGKFDNVKVDRFFLDAARGTLVSEHKDLVLNFTEETPLSLQDGQKFYVPEGSALLNELDGRILVVTYNSADKLMSRATSPSDPALTITVLWERPVHMPKPIEGAEPLTEGTNGYLGPDWISNEGISVNDKKLETTWQRIDNAYYVPFRAIVNELNLGDSIVWDSNNMIVTANNGTDVIAFAINANHFIVGNKIATLDHPAILQDGTTYVPWQFFRDVFGIDARFNAGQIYINSESAMEYTTEYMQ